MMESALTIAPDMLMQERQAEQLGSRAKVARPHLTEAEQKKLKKIAQDFDALFTGMMLKSMRSTVPEDTLTGGGRAEETYRYMLDQEYATAAAKRGGSGSIAAMVEKELLKRYAVPARNNSGTKSEEH